MLRCAITDRSLLPGDEPQKRSALVAQAARWAAEGIDLIQLREKDLGPFELADIALPMLEAIAPHPGTLLLINGSLRAAIESQAHGVHLPANSSILPAEVRRRYSMHSLPRPTVTVSCHSLAETQIAQRNGADAILFSPVFGKTVAGQKVTPAAGIEALRTACTIAAPIPVYALGGVTEENAPLCLEAGATGIAGIRLFHR